MKKCPCDSGSAFADCCEPYLKGLLNAPTAEALMRSRYSAYVEHTIDYIIDTCTHDDKETIDVKQTKDWSEKSTWLGLKIYSTEKGGVDDTEGMVEFEASYEMGGLKDSHHEKANFVKRDGRWLYDQGSVEAKTIVRTAPKVGRNEPCPCGSGKKYKHCCVK